MALCAWCRDDSSLDLATRSWRPIVNFNTGASKSLPSQCNRCPGTAHVVLLDFGLESFESRPVRCDVMCLNPNSTWGRGFGRADESKLNPGSTGGNYAGRAKSVFTRGAVRILGETFAQWL